MCGRFTLRISPAELAEIFELLRTPEVQPRYNIAPSQPVLAVREREGARELAVLQWGLIPGWSKVPKSGPINARSETVATKPTFKNAFRRRRCLIPADGFYEWKQLGPKEKQPYFIHRLDDKLFAFAGLWEGWRGPDGSSLESCAIVTTDTNRRLAELHDRMPVVLEREDYAEWLDPTNEDVESLQRLLMPAPDDFFEIRPVSKSVNSPRNDGPDCLEPEAAQGTLF